MRPPATQYYTLKQLQPCSVVLSALAYLGHADDAAAPAVCSARSGG
jgi:hypothetical protein